MYSIVKECPENQEEGKIVARHLVKDYIIKEKRGLFVRKQKRVIHAVRDISLQIPQGKITGVLGINGAGKTTTIRMLASVIAPTSGSLTMNGVDAVKNHLWVKERINMISGLSRLPAAIRKIRREEPLLEIDCQGESQIFWQSVWIKRNRIE